MNTSAATELHNLHLSHGVISTYKGEPGDANGIKRWLRSTSKAWESSVIAASRRAAKEVASSLRRQASEQAAKQAKRKAAKEAAANTEKGDSMQPSIASMVHMLQCLDPLAPASPGMESPDGVRTCVILLGTTVPAASQFATGRNEIAQALREAAVDSPAMRFMRVMRLDVPSVIAQRWKAGTPQAHLAMALTALLAGGKGGVKGSYMDTLSAEVASAAQSAVQALGGSDSEEAAFAGAFGRMAAAAALASSQTFVIEFASMLGRWSDEAAAKLPAVVVLQTTAAGQLTVTPVLGRALGELAQSYAAPDTGSFDTKMSQKEARAAAVAAVVRGALDGDRPALKVPASLAHAVVSMLQARVAADKR